MQENSLNGNNIYPSTYPQSPNAVSINIYSPQAYGNNTQNPTSQVSSNCCPIYGPNTQNIPVYPANYNNMFNPYGVNPNTGMQNPIMNPAQNYSVPNNMPGYIPNYIPYYPVYPQNPQENTTANAQNSLDGNNAYNTNSLFKKTNQDIEGNTDLAEETKTKDKKEEKKKTIVPLNDEYIKSLENYLDDENPKIRLIGIKEIMERFKEDENRKDNKSLIPLLNKALQDTSAAVRFLALTTLQLGYSVGDDETVKILKEIQNKNKDKTGEDQLLASQILLKMSAPQEIEMEK